MIEETPPAELTAQDPQTGAPVETALEPTAGAIADVLATATYSYMGYGGLPPELTSLGVANPSDGIVYVYRPGDSVDLTDELHTFLKQEGHLFAEDIVQTPGG